MHYLISKLLERRGIKQPDELSEDEQGDIKRWELIFKESDISIEKIREFCQNQIKKIEEHWKDLGYEHTNDTKLISIHTVYKTLLDLIDSPREERENLERYLQSLIDKV